MDTQAGHRPTTRPARRTVAATSVAVAAATALTGCEATHADMLQPDQEHVAGLLGAQMPPVDPDTVAQLEEQYAQMLGEPSGAPAPATSTAAAATTVYGFLYGVSGDAAAYTVWPDVPSTHLSSQITPDGVPPPGASLVIRGSTTVETDEFDPDAVGAALAYPHARSDDLGRRDAFERVLEAVDGELVDAGVGQADRLLWTFTGTSLAGEPVAVKDLADAIDAAGPDRVLDASDVRAQSAIEGAATNGAAGFADPRNAPATGAPLPTRVTVADLSPTSYGVSFHY